MSHADPNVHWDGQQWLRWDGVRWVPDRPVSQPVYQHPGPSAYGWSPPQMAAPVYRPQGMGSPGLLTDQRDRTTEAVIAWILTVLTLAYFLPWAIAATRGKSNAGMIGLVNFLLGWTLIGWIVALVMACGAHQVVGAGPGVMLVNHTGYYPAGPGSVPPGQWPAQPQASGSLPPAWPSPPRGGAGSSAE